MHTDSGLAGKGANDCHVFGAAAVIFLSLSMPVSVGVESIAERLASPRALRSCLEALVAGA